VLRTALSIAVLAALGGAVVAEGAAAAGPTRAGDRRIALEIGLTAKDVGAGWSEATASRSPYSIDTGSALSSGLTATCGGSATSKTETDLVVTAGAISSFAHPGGTAVSIMMMWKTPSLAAEQVAAVADVRGLRPCIASELAKAFKPAGYKTTLVGLRELPFATGDQVSDSLHIAAELRATGRSARVYLDLIFQQDGRGLVETVYVSFGAPAAGGLEHRLAAISSRRLIRFAR
jgi:hypothetical protein